jgi:hypothetical protein
MDIGALRAVILREHGVRLSPADPILIVAMMQEKLLAEALAEVRSTVQLAARGAAAASAQQFETARQQAEALINQASEAAAARLKAAGESVATALLADMWATVKLAARDAAAASAQQIETTRQQAEALMNQASEAAAARMKTAAESVATAILADMRQQVTQAERAARLAFRAAWATVCIALLALAGTAGLWVARLH